jgi:hypothetical protein
MEAIDSAKSYAVRNGLYVTGVTSSFHVIRASTSEQDLECFFIENGHIAAFNRSSLLRSVASRLFNIAHICSLCSLLVRCARAREGQDHGAVAAFETDFRMN